MKRDVHPVLAMREEFSDWRLWLARALVVSASALAGMVVVAFTMLTEQAADWFHDEVSIHWWACLLWIPAVTALVAWLTIRFVPGATGSGIPQVMAALDSGVDEERRSMYVSLKLSASKMLLTMMGAMAGLSLGREGPSVQIAAGVLHSVRKRLPRRALVSDHGLLVAGGAAGIAAAFNTPLGGILFAIEELAGAPEKRNSGLLISGIVLAGLVAVSMLGNATYFGVIRVPRVDLSLFLPGLMVAVMAGLFGGLFSRLLIKSLGGQGTDRVSRFRKAYPVRFAFGIGLAVAVIGIVTQGMTYGSGYLHTRQMLAGASDTPVVYVFFKFIATWLTTWSGVPAGIFAPSLAIGAALGNDVALLLHSPQAVTLIALGMVGFLAAATQAPLTSFIIVMEMVDGHALVLSLMACALVASAVSRIISRPLYRELAAMQLARANIKPSDDDDH